MGQLDGARAVVTGGASGIGAATVRRLTAEGARVAVLDRDRPGAEAVATEVGGLAVEVDVRDADAVVAAFTSAAEQLGGLTVVVNDAGVGSLKRLHTYEPSEVDRLFAVNLTGTLNGLRAAVPLLQAAGGGAVVNVASASGMRPTRGEAPYAAAKAGVIALTMSAALEYGPDGIRVNCVSPGFIRTAMTEFAFSNPDWIAPLEARTPLGRAGTPDEVADVIVFLASDASRYVTGHNLVVDGGSLLPSAQVDHLLGELLGE
jgi:NAD(P)-dependent dehydrogenase (short-subunit alcohol dehydrogenase family)